MEECVTTLVIGDPHFKARQELVCQSYIDRIVDIARQKQPTFIVILGDVLHTHETVKVQPHKLVEQFFERLSQITDTYVLMGNHDLINANQYLTDNHIYGPFKKWESLYIVDKPLQIEVGDKEFVFVPYVPPGKFVDALNTLVLEGKDWNIVDCIFAHQEFYGANMGPFASTKGDVWDENYPLVISGHIHNPQNLGENIMYPGNSIQYDYNEHSNKKVWYIEWLDESFKIDKISIGLKKKKILKYTIEELLQKEGEHLWNNGNEDLKIEVTGTSIELKNFRKSGFYTSLQKKGVIISFNLLKETPIILKGKTENLSFASIFEGLIASKNKDIQREYEEVFKT